MDNTRERRTYIRVDLPVECTILFGDKKLPGECLNISATGMSIVVKSSVSLNIGDEVEIQLDDADERTDHVWHMRQTFRDENDDRDFAIWCDVDLDATQEAGEAVFANYRVGFIEELLA